MPMERFGGAGLPAEMPGRVTGRNRAVRSYHDVPGKELERWQGQLLGGGSAQVVLRGATILSCDETVGDLPVGDVIVSEGRIVDVGADLSAAMEPDSVVVELGGMVLIPGMVDAHRHTWQSQFRRLLADVALADYLPITHGGVALHYSPHDMYVGTYLGLLGALDAGITTVLDFSHNSRSPEHADEVFRAYAEAEIRAVHAGAPPNVGGWGEHLPEDLLRLEEDWVREDGLISVRMGVDIRRIRPIDELLSFARSNGLGVTIDAVAGDSSAEELQRLHDSAQLGPDLTFIHCTDLPDEIWRHMGESKVGVTLSTTDQLLGIADGVPPIQAALRHGLSPSLSVDIEVSEPGDLFSQMRLILALQRMQTTQGRHSGANPDGSMMSARDVLRLATVGGAEAVGLGQTVGCIAPGRRADIVGIDAEDVNNLPLSSAIGTVVMGADIRNVEFVLVDGVLRKWRGRLVGVDLDELRSRVHESRDRLATESGWKMDQLGLHEWKGLDHPDDFVDLTQRPD